MLHDEIQVWDGDGAEPKHVTVARLKRQQRVEAVDRRLQERKGRLEAAAKASKSPLLLPCCRFMPSLDGSRCHFLFSTTEVIDGILFCRLMPGGPKLSSLTIRYPEIDDPRVMQNPVGWEMSDVTVDHFRLLHDPMHFEDHGEHGMEPIQLGPFEWSMTVSFGGFKNVSKLLTDKMKHTFCRKG